jgi:hypothetical protein
VSPGDSPSSGRTSRVADSRFLTHDSVGHAPMEVLPEVSAADAAAFLSET